MNKTEIQREKMPALRIGEDSILHARQRYKEGTPERELFENILIARIPYALLSYLTGIEHGSIRDMVTGRKNYTEDAKEKLCGPVNKIIANGIERGVYPCSDLAVIQPVTRLLLENMATKKRVDTLTEILKNAGLLPPAV